MPVLVVNKASEVAIGSFWVLAIIDNSSRDLLPLDVGIVNNVLHVCAMNYISKNAGVIGIDHITPIGAAAVDFQALESQERSLLVKY